MMWVLHDGKVGLRMLLKRPGFTALAIVTLALGIGANTAIFSVVNAVLLRPLPFPEPERLVTLWERNPKQGYEENAASAPNFAEWRNSNAFERISAFTFEPKLNLSGDERHGVTESDLLVRFAELRYTAEMHFTMELAAVGKPG